jgi:LysM repeat protein
MSRHTVIRLRFIACVWLLLALPACVRPGPRPDMAAAGTATAPPAAATSDATLAAPLTGQLGTPIPDYAGQPTPDAAHYDIAPGTESSVGSHTVAAGETLGTIAQRYNTTVADLITLNGLTNPDVISVGQQLQVPGVEIQRVVGPEFKIVPDSELVYGPGAAGFDTRAFVTALGGRLVSHQEEVEGQSLDGPAIVQLVADRHSVNPRLLLAVLEHQAGWVTQANPPERANLLGYVGPTASPGLYVQLSWAANLLNLGFYGRADGGLRGFNLGETTQVTFAPTINHGTAGVQRFLGAVEGVTTDSWQRDAGRDGLFATYTRLFGNPFGYAHEPLLPAGLAAPALELPWAAGETWYFTGGPHGAWNSGSAWGALDFVPPGEQAGCITTDAWVTAMAPGVVVRSGHGAVVVDLDGGDEAADGYAGTGWAVTSMHLETRDRIAAGTRVQTGDRLGHPSCEGGFSNGTHVHIVRSYNGRWISADGDMPFEMSGWLSSGAGAEYDGYLTRGDATKEACVCREDVNAVTR